MNPKCILIIDGETTFARTVRLNLEQTSRYLVREEYQAMHAITATHEFKPPPPS